MADAYFIEHKGKQIYFLDLAGASREELAEVLEKSRQDLSHLPEDSVLSVADVRDVLVYEGLSSEVRKQLVHNRPYIKASAIVGMNAWQKIVFDALRTFSGRYDVRYFETLEEAKEWLCGL